MAQTGFTPIQIYRSSTASAAPTSGNLVAGELAINTADGKLFYLDNLNAVQVIGWKLVPVSAGGTGTTTSTGTGNVVLSDSPTFTGIVTANNVRSNSTTIASASTITPTSNTTNQYTVTALAVPATIAIPSGSPIDGQKLLIRIKDNGTVRALTWTTTAGGFRVIGTTLPTTTTASKVIYVGCAYNSQDSFWDVLAVATQA